MGRPRKVREVRMVRDVKTRELRPHKTGWKHPNPIARYWPRDSHGRMLPEEIVMEALALLRDRQIH